MAARPGEVRIIGGCWRGRKIPLANSGQLRPTPDRVRETLFNWLMAHIRSARCLDLFSGSGALALEALSRGAARAVCVEIDANLRRGIEASGERLGAAQNLVVHRADAVQWLRENPLSDYDVVFLDPPYGSDLLPAALRSIDGRLSPSALLYLEWHRPLDELPLPLPIYKSGRAGAVHYGLLGGERFLKGSGA